MPDRALTFGRYRLEPRSGLTSGGREIKLTPKALSLLSFLAERPGEVITNDELSQWVDTSDEWIRERTGIRERRFADKREALSDVSMPACRDALAQAGVEGKDIDLLLVATVTQRSKTQGTSLPRCGSPIAHRSRCCPSPT